jgi:hypothetical protein
MYIVTYTDGNGCYATSAPTLVTVNALPASPTITASGATNFCAGDSVVLSSSQAGGNLWSSGAGSQDITVFTSGNYTVTYTDGNGCSASSSQMSVTVNALPSVNMGAFSDVCSYVAPYSLTGGIPAGGMYSGPGVSSGLFDPAAAGVGVHTITYTYIDGNGCSGTAQSTVEVQDCANLNDLAALGISLYPNPTYGQVQIQTTGEMIESVRLVDASGRIVLDLKPRESKVILDLHALSSGMYTVEIHTASAQARTQVVKQ